MAVRQEDVPRIDVQSSVESMPAFGPSEAMTDENQVFFNDDGSIDLIPLDYEEEEDKEVHHDQASDEEWNDNLAGHLNESERRGVADKLIEYLLVDEESRKEHFQRMEEAIKLLGITTPGQDDDSAPFEGASVVTHPMIAEAVTQFQARAIEELMPASGPVKAAIIGKSNEERVAQSQRVETFMNYQLTEQDEEYFWNTDQMLFYLGLSGTAFKKAQQDPISGMIVSRFVKDKDFIVPYNAKSLATAPRYCHRYAMWENDILRAKKRGLFLEDARDPVAGGMGVDLPGGANTGRENFEDKADDRTRTEHYDDVVTTILEYHIDIRLKWDDDEDIAPPYIITVDMESSEVLAIRRNWKREDETKQRRLWFAMYRYLPGLGFYGMGMLHIVGNLAIAAGGAMRALLDAGAMANFQGGFKVKSQNLSGEMRLEPGVWKDVDATTDDLSKMFYTPPFKEPSPALAAMLTSMIEEGRRYLTTTENMVGDASNTGPVGTTLALIEQGSKVFSAIHKRMHVSARREYKMLAALNFEFMAEDSYPYEVEGESQEVLRQDFDGRVDIIPVSDPNIWSSTQRIAQAQAAVELMASAPDLYTVEQRRVAHRRLLEALKVPDVDELLPAKMNLRLDPVAENMNMMVGASVRAFYEQDHDAHMAVHQNFGAKMAGSNPDLVAELEPVMRAHLMEHMAFKYRQEVERDLGIVLPPHSLFDQDDEEELPPAIEAQLSVAMAKKISPPPPPQPDEQQQAEDQQAQAEAKQAEDDADALTIAKIERDAAVAARTEANKQTAFDAEEKRKQAAFDAEEMRKDATFGVEAQRGEQQAQAQERDAMLSRLTKKRDAKSQMDIKAQAAKPAATAKPKAKAKSKPKGAK